jgi:putative membrane protein
MSTAAQVFVAVAGALHLAIFAMESLLIRRPAVYRRFLITSQADADTVRPWAVNQGFYNLFLALGALGGLVFGGDRGHAVALFACACMAAAGLVLLATDRRMLRPAAMQALPPVAALLLAAFL